MAFALAVIASVVRAQDSAVRIDYDAPAACPSEALFRHEVESRMKRGRLAEPGEIARTFRIALSNEADKSIARMKFTDADGREATREVTAPTCEEAARAIALVAALAIEERAPDETAPAPRSTATTPAPSATAPSPPPASNLDRDRRIRIGVGALAGIEQSFAPELAARLELTLELQRRILIAPSYADSGPVEIPARGRARFRLYSVSIRAYPLDFVRSPVVSLSLGAGIDAGLLHAAGERGPGVVEAKSTNTPWLNVMVTPRFTVDLEETLSFQLIPAVGFPVTRREFVFEEPEDPVHKVPVVVWSVLGGAIVRFE